MLGSRNPLITAPPPKPSKPSAPEQPNGLAGDQAAGLLAEFGPNALPRQHRRSVWRRVALQFRDPLIVVLLAATGLTLATGDRADTLIIAIVIAVNTTVGVGQEIKADGAIAALRSLTAVDARVVRDGVAISIDAESIVPGDLLLISEGDIVAADARVVEAAGVLVDESALTGESVPVVKNAGAELAAGTEVVHGRAGAVVTRTGADSAMGRIAATLTTGPSLTPLQHRLAALGRILAGVAGGLGLVVMTIGLVRGQPVELMVITAVSLVVAAVPESLPAVVTLSLALGARRMADRHAIVRRLPAVETLGSVTVIATDKTGTLTEGKMVAEHIWTPAHEVVLTGTGFEPSGAILDADGSPVSPSAADLAELLTAGVLCNDANLQPPDGPSGSWRAVGDPTEAALLAAAAKLPLEASKVRDHWLRIEEVPFDSVQKRMLTVHQRADGTVLVICKGAPESVVTSDLLRDEPRLLEEALVRSDAYAASGHRVLAIASCRRDGLPENPAEIEAGLRLNGLVAFADPPRASAAATIDACRAAGIVPVLVTGDHQATARNIAERVGVSSPGTRVAGDGELGEAAPDPRDVSVFARTTPTEKLQLVTAWQKRGDVVAMTGDGVNDAPALRRADIGVAMGRRGTDIARQAADMVLADDDLGTIVAAVEEGRRVYANVRRFLLYALAGGGAELLVMLLGPAVGFPLPLLPSQILWLNLLTHGLPGVAMGAEPASRNVMRRPPRPVDESVLGDWLWVRALVLATLLAATAIGAGLWARGTEVPQRTSIFLVLGMAQFGVALAVRAQPGTRKNPFLLLAVAASFLLLVGGVYVSPLRSLLGTHTLEPAQAALLSTAAVIGYALTHVVRRIHETEI